MLFFKKKETPEPQNRILVVEDDSSTRGLMHILLKEYGQVSFAENGAEAVEAVAKALDDNASFNLICLDIMMPEMDGLEALKQIRRIEQSHNIKNDDGVKVIMTTTASQEAKVMKAFHYGCNGYLVKPISKEALLKEMKKLPLIRSANAQWRGK